MKHVMTAVAALSLCALGMVGCSDPMAPQSVANEVFIADALEQSMGDHLLTCGWQNARSVSGEIGPRGGELELGDDRVRVPAGALLRPTVLTLSAPAGKLRMVRFEAASRGLAHLEQPAEITISYDGCAVQSGHAGRTVTVESAAFSTYAVMY